MDAPRLTKTLFSRKPAKLSGTISLAIVLLFGVFSQLYWSGELQFWRANRLDVLADGKIWQIFTATMIHADWGHFLSNAYMLFILGLFVIGYFGFWIYPVICFILAGLTNLVTIATYPDQVRLMGASGLVYVLAGFWLTMFWLVQRQHNWHRRLIRVLGVALVILFPTTFEPTVSYRAHAIGFAVGLIYALIHFSFNKSSIRSHETWMIPEDSPASDSADIQQH